MLLLILIFFYTHHELSVPTATIYTFEAINKKEMERVNALLTQLDEIKEKLGEVYDIYFDDIIEGNMMSDAQRRALLGSGVRRYGFIDKVSDVALVNSEFAPPFLNAEDADNTDFRRY